MRTTTNNTRFYLGDIINTPNGEMRVSSTSGEYLEVLPIGQVGYRSSPSIPVTVGADGVQQIIIDGLVIRAADSQEETYYHIVSARHYNDLRTDLMYVQDDRYEPMIFDSIAEAEEWIEDAESETYYLAHNERCRPDYYVVESDYEIHLSDESMYDWDSMHLIDEDDEDNDPDPDTACYCNWQGDCENCHELMAEQDLERVIDAALNQ